MKSRVGKLRADILALCARLAPACKIRLLELAPAHLTMLQSLPSFDQHRDPFDRLIIAQAIREEMVLVTYDQNAALYPVRVLVP